MQEKEIMQRTPKSGQNILYSSHPNLTMGTKEDEELIKNINLRKRKNPEQTQFQDLEDSLKKSIKETLNSEIEEIRMQNSRLIESNNEIIKLLQLNASNHKELSDRLVTLESKNTTALERINELETQLNSIQKKMMINMIEIRNIPREDKEDVKELVNTICNTLEIQHLKDANIYRKGKGNAPIIIECKQVKEKEELLKGVKKYNREKKADPLNTERLGLTGIKSRVYISECLSSLSKKLLIASRDLVKNGTYKYCWISRGNVLLRKDDGQPAIVINSLKQIEDLTSK